MSNLREHLSTLRDPREDLKNIINHGEGKVAKGEATTTDRLLLAAQKDCAKSLDAVFTHIADQDKRIEELERAVRQTAASVHVLRLPMMGPHTMKAVADTIEATALAVLGKTAQHDND
jgi:hypothetical protein